MSNLVYQDTIVWKLNMQKSLCYVFVRVYVKPVFHFKRTVPKHIKNVFKFQNFVNVDWFILLILIREYTRKYAGFINLFSICACSPVRFGTIWAKWKTGFNLCTVTVMELIVFLYRVSQKKKVPSIEIILWYNLNA
jgi:hypothetical protein